MSQQFSKASLVYWFLGEHTAGNFEDQLNYLFFGRNDRGQAFVWVLWTKEQIKALTQRLDIEGDHLDQLNEQIGECKIVQASSVSPIEIQGIAARALIELTRRCCDAASGAPQIMIPPPSTICGLLPPSFDTSGQVRPANVTLAYHNPDDVPNVFVFSCIRDVRNHLWSLPWVPREWRETELRKLFGEADVIPWSSNTEPIHVTGFAARMLAGVVHTRRIAHELSTHIFRSQGDA